MCTSLLLWSYCRFVFIPPDSGLAQLKPDVCSDRDPEQLKLDALATTSWSQGYGITVRVILGWIHSLCVVFPKSLGRDEVFAVNGRVAMCVLNSALWYFTCKAEHVQVLFAAELCFFHCFLSWKNHHQCSKRLPEKQCQGFTAISDGLWPKCIYICYYVRVY